MLIKILKHMAIWLCVAIPLELIGIIILAPFLFFYPKHLERLPKFLNWFNNYDSPIYGDQWYVDQNSLNGGDPYSWLNRFNWIALRNPINNFAYNYLGYVWKGTETIKELQTQANVILPKSLETLPPGILMKDWTVITFIDDIGGQFYIEFENGYWQYYKVRSYKIFNNKLCLRISIGWKFKKYWNMQPGELVQFVFTVVPFAKFGD